MDKQKLLQRVDAVLAKGVATNKSMKISSYQSKPGDMFSTKVVSWVDPGLASQFRAAGLSLLKDMYGEDNHFYKDFVGYTANTAYPSGYEQATALISVVKEEINNDWIESTKGLLAGEVFDDLLDRAQHLFDERYKDAAAVIAGSSLEAHLKRLCTKHGVDTDFTDPKGNIKPKAADTINADLVKANAYDKNEQKQITAWLGIRNEAAHGNGRNVKEELIKDLITGVRQFISRCPA